MRRILVILVCALAAVPAAVAGPNAVGDGVLELKAVYGSVVIGKSFQPARGLLWGQMDRGKLIVEDPILGDGRILVSGWETKVFTPAADDGSPAVTTYTGTNIHFRVTGGKYRLVFRGASGLDLTAIGAGIAYINASENAIDAGYYAVDAGDWIPAPLLITKAVPFGAQPTPLPAPGP
jgi:hypothetical protein